MWIKYRIIYFSGYHTYLVLYFLFHNLYSSIFLFNNLPWIVAKFPEATMSMFAKITQGVKLFLQTRAECRVFKTYCREAFDREWLSDNFGWRFDLYNQTFSNNQVHVGTARYMSCSISTAVNVQWCIYWSAVHIGSMLGKKSNTCPFAHSRVIWVRQRWNLYWMFVW